MLDQRFKSSLWRAVCVLALFAAPVVMPAHAVGPNDWMSFNKPNTGAVDRNFIRRWEANPPPGYPTLSPGNIAATDAAIKRYELIVKGGGWKELPSDQLAMGSNGPAVEDLRDRLKLSGDLQDESWMPQHFDYYLEKAVKRFQASNGLAPTGIVDKRTRAALNVSAEVRLRQLKLGLKRLKEYTRHTAKGRYVVVNIPAAQIEAIENDRVVSRHAGVVGKTDRKTPLLTSSIHELNFNPIWRLPPTVISQDLIPKGRQMQRAGQSVLVKYGIDAYDGEGRKVDPEKINWNSSRPHALSYRQKPGEGNPMGFLKINFHNGHSVYMHDTPSDSLFGRNFRAASSGCVRVQNIEQLATWLLADQGSWDRSRVDEMKAKVKREDVRLKKPVRLYFAYITAWATEDGVVQFRRDLYLKDGVGRDVASY
ncbi:Putative peptidoglycan binding domain-containing protein [Filomicrobium insigne]|uniref:Peptidoglycan binding domain-containing protein n=1 Tax=Filomicrobium insigne TaxID=418854 RepID=A0A1H0Q9L9_9HYPH|nr:L,D-transpeptidase family protein [Filomicrobium insigne]SDP13880.1 Putative peptidoglycan binding domain-containing protein [Filomicrobium insigne]